MHYAFQVHDNLYLVMNLLTVVISDIIIPDIVLSVKNKQDFS